MLTHADIWKAIDTLAREHGFSASGLARRAGLDPTTFNKSKRATAEGRLRWPGTESISKVLQATGASLGEFVAYIEAPDGNRVTQRIPVIGHAQAGARGFFDDAGYPTGSGWDEVEFPHIPDPNAYALEISGDGMDPVYRDGDLVVISPAAGLRRGDRVVVKTLDGQILARELVRRSALKVELAPVNADRPDPVLPADRIVWIHRIVWASQ